MRETKFFICKHCGNIVGVINDAGVPMTCCGQKMTRLIPGTTEGAVEKHMPVVSVNGDKVKVNVGSVAHPTAEEHSILWVYLQTDRGGQRKNIAVGDEPIAEFALCNEKPLSVYAYCNLHGLWKSDI